MANRKQKFSFINLILSRISKAITILRGIGWPSSLYVIFFSGFESKILGVQLATFLIIAFYKFNIIRNSKEG